MQAPRFPQKPVARQNEDGSIELECFVEASPQPEIKWYYGQNELPLGDKFNFRLDNTGAEAFSAILQIKELDDTDAGAYRCTIMNQHGKGNANFNLKLNGFNAPTFVEMPKISSRDNAQVLVLEFKAKSKTPANVVWTKGEDVVGDNERIGIIVNDEGNEVYHCVMEIRDPNKENDAGQFLCTMKNDSGKLTATFTVKFEVPPGAPTFVGKPQILQKVVNGGDAAVVFDVGFLADTQPKVIWLNPKGKKMKESSRIKFILNKNGAPNGYVAQLQLKNYKSKDSGTYICNIRNEAGEANAELALEIEGVD